ncbi:MAG: xanthine dehydrogenase family protein subunit M [Defluviicoccus sp.]|nr:xanthine dehydrogenase family protein subunit M [Defluviicoccus sp.]MDE0277139.1 xanthine dehydrogenase family protein subunit M [Defluviicoccus sp.]
MKPPPFTYHDPRTIPEVLDLLAEKDNARLLSGGQSLMPMLNMRYVLPDDVIDLNRVDGLSGIEAANGSLGIAGMTRQRDIEFSDVVASRCPIMIEAILQVGHRQTRNRGTLGGSLAHLDPSAELPAVAMALDATIHVESKRGKRDIAMADFPAGYMTPSIELDEMVTGATFPLWEEGHGYAFIEFARRHGDFAIVSAGALMTTDGAGKVDRVSIVVSGVGPSPLRCTDAERMILGQTPELELFREAAETARAFDAMEDIHAPSSYRQHLAAVLSRRALEKAQTRLGGSNG